MSFVLCLQSASFSLIALKFRVDFAVDLETRYENLVVYSVFSLY